MDLAMPITAGQMAIAAADLGRKELTVICSVLKGLCLWLMAPESLSPPMLTQYVVCLERPSGFSAGPGVLHWQRALGTQKQWLDRQNCQMQVLLAAAALWKVWGSDLSAALQYGLVKSGQNIHEVCRMGAQTIGGSAAIEDGFGIRILVDLRLQWIHFGGNSLEISVQHIGALNTRTRETVPLISKYPGPQRPCFTSANLDTPIVAKVCINSCASTGTACHQQSLSYRREGFVGLESTTSRLRGLKVWVFMLTLECNSQLVPQLRQPCELGRIIRA